MSEISVDISRDRQDVDVAPLRRHPNTCPKCRSHYRSEELEETLWVCPQCSHHFSTSAFQRVGQLTDAGSFIEIATELRSADPLAFADLRPYAERLAEAEAKTGLGTRWWWAPARSAARPYVLAVMDFAFMGGSMGSVVGEKFCRGAELASDLGVPFVSVAASGGARMQENILALMQMARTVMAIDALHDLALPYISIIAHPATGGVIASFAALGDVILAEPGALMSFAGPRVVEQTTREKLPEDFGLAESNLRFGHVDAIVDRRELAGTLERLFVILSRVETETTADFEQGAIAGRHRPSTTTAPEARRWLGSPTRSAGSAGASPSGARSRRSGMPSSLLASRGGRTRSTTRSGCSATSSS